MSEMLRQMITYVPAQIIPGLVNFLALALYTRLLSAEVYGRYALILAIVVMVKIVAFEWLRLGLFRFFQKMERDGMLTSLLSTVITGFMMTCLLVSLVWVVTLHFVQMDASVKTDLFIALPLLLVWALFEQILQMNRAALKPVRYGLLSANRAILSLGMALFLIVLLDKGEKGLIIGLITGTAISVLIDLPRWLRGLSPRLIERELISDLLRYGMPFTVTLALGLVISVSDRFLLNYFIGPDAVGVYAASYDLANQTVMMVFTLLNLAAYPVVLKALEQTGGDSAKEQLSKYIVILMAVALPSSVGLAIIAEPLANVFLGEDFRHVAAQVIPWVAWSAFLMGVKAFYADLSFQIGLRIDLQIWPVAAAALLNVLLNLWWIPIYGVMGAVGATCAAYLLALVLSLLIGRRIFTLPFPGPDIGRIILATLVMGTLLVSTPIHSGGWAELSLMLVVGMGSFSMMVWITNVGGVRGRLAPNLRHLRGLLKYKGR